MCPSINRNVNLNDEFIDWRWDNMDPLNRRDKGFTGISGNFILPDINKRSALSQNWSPFLSGEIGQRRFQSRPNSKSPFTDRSAVEGSANIGYTLKPDTYRPFNPVARGSVGFNYYDNKFLPTMGTTIGASYQNKGRVGDLNLEGGIGGTGVWGDGSQAAYLNTHNTGPYLKGSYTFNDANRKNAWLKNLGINAGIKKDVLTGKTDTEFGITKKFDMGGSTNRYSGLTHEEGGIPLGYDYGGQVNENKIEVEDGEVSWTDPDNGEEYIFSERLQVPKSKKRKKS